MDEDHEQDEEHEILSATTPIRSRTLFHYFKKTPKENGDSKAVVSKHKKKSDVPEDTAETDVDVASRIFEPVIGHKLSRSKRKAQPQDQEHSSSSRSKTKRPRKKESENIVAEESPDEGVDDIEHGDIGEIPSTPVSEKGQISTFFRRVSKEEYKKRMSDSLSHVVLTVKAQVHVSAEKKIPKASEAEIQAPCHGRRRHDSNVSRSSLVTDNIVILESVTETSPGAEIQFGRKEENECSNSNKISNTLFRRKRKPKEDSNDGVVDRPSLVPVEDESVDFDFLQVNGLQTPQAAIAKDDSDDGGKGNNSSQVSPQLFKDRRPKGKRGKARVNYDSDSIDVEVLSSITKSKAEPLAGDTSFHVLMNKPIFGGLEPNPPIESKENSPQSDKENKEQQKQEETTTPNAFTRIMKPKQVASKAASNEPSITQTNQENEQRMNKSAKKRGRKRKMLIEQEKVHDDLSTSLPSRPLDEEQEKESGRRRSSVRISRNQAQYEERQRQQQELDQLIDAEINPRKVSRRGGQSAEIDVTSETDDDDAVVEKIILNPRKKNKSTQKLAPIFIKGRKANPIRVVEDPEKTAARKAFLLSSAPDSLRTQIDAKKADVDLNSSFSDFLSFFPTLNHVKQMSSIDTKWLHSLPAKLDAFLLRSEVPNRLLPSSLSSQTWHGSRNLKACHAAPPKSVTAARASPGQIFHFVKSLKMLNDGAFPVNLAFRRFLERKIEWDSLEAEARSKNVNLNDIADEDVMHTRRQLRRRKKKTTKEKTCSLVQYDPEMKSSLQWTMKYAPQISTDVIGNKMVVGALKDWMEAWKKCRKKRMAKKSKKGCDSFIVSSSDEDMDSFSEDDDFDSDSLSNTALLLGPSGVGKTATVYALASELGYKVLEVNASSARSGKQVLSQLHEATQSHHVHKEKRKEEKLGTALILFEDIDVVFEEQDEGFYGAVNHLIATTKRPILLTSSNLDFWPQKHLKLTPEVFLFEKVPTSCTARYLQLMAASEGFPVDLPSIEALVALNGDVVCRSILDLQFWAMSGASGYIQSCQESADEESGPTLACPPGTLDESLAAGSIDSPAKTEEKENLIARLMSLGTNMESEAPVRPHRGCRLALEEEGHLLDAQGLFQKSGQVEHLWHLGLADFYHGSKDVILPWPQKLQESTMCSSDKELWHKPSKTDIVETRRALEALSRVAEVSSHFLRCDESKVSSALQMEIASFLQHQSLHQAGQAVRDLVAQSANPDALAVKVEDCPRLCLASVDDVKDEADVLNCFEAEVTNHGRHFRLDTLPAVRLMARLEEMRRSGGSQKKSRSGRFLHYFETQEMYFKKSTLNALCSAFTLVTN